ncbi:MAG: hypothetical protein JXB45_09050 [Candidatus Krumholzibacteriota bacterium]|nr:hypothetical protein [Candidatus Krumholzibacteriota bacterium]
MLSELQLLHGYLEERDCYLEILGLARDLRDILKNDHSAQEILSNLRSKNRLMQRIDAIDKSIDDEKRRYHRNIGKNREVAKIIDELSSLVETILVVERENEILFSTAGYKMSKSPETGVTADFVRALYTVNSTGE